MDHLYELLQKIKERPGLYLGQRSITRLHAFIGGYSLAQHELGVPSLETEHILGEFQEWIQHRFEIGSSHSWAQIILFYSEDEQEAFQQFFDLFEEFLEQHEPSTSKEIEDKASFVAVTEPIEAI
ncbi:hypothetical protein L0152_27785 [bacterium]|nr:hypothetical protein [bacterium]